MKSSLFAAVAVFASELVAAHGDHGLRSLLGRRQMEKLGLRTVKHGFEAAPIAAPALVERATNGRCGPGLGSCAAGVCCSPAGYCGNGPDYCSAPDCQFAYGPGCDANTVPSGSSTASIARPLNGQVPYGGEGIYDCTANGVIALTFDDGPYTFTDHLLDVLKQYGAKATFFITGNNLGKGPIDTNWATVIKRMATDGHQIASHTWSHQNLSSLNAQQFQNQIVYNEMAFRNILGYFPTYMRPPYSECNTACQKQLRTLGYHVTYFDLDTDDYDNTTPDKIQNAKNNFDNAVKGYDPANSDFLSIEHDIHQQTSYNLTTYILQRMQTLGYRAVTVGECLNDAPTNWYRAAGGQVLVPSSSTTATTATTATTIRTSTTTTSSAPTSSATGLKVSTTGSCKNGVTCQGSAYGNCCSQYGYCGADAGYCGTGCDPNFGSCGTGTGTTSSSTSTSRTSTSTSAAPSSSSTALVKSPDGSCNNGKTCLNSGYGNCCSQYNWCGSTAGYCGTGCQSKFGTCT